MNSVCQHYKSHHNRMITAPYWYAFGANNSDGGFYRNAGMHPINLWGYCQFNKRDK